MQRNSNDFIHTTGNIHLPLAVVKQWLVADEDDSNAAWHYVAGLCAGCIIARPDISEELMFLHTIAKQRGFMTADEIKAIQPEKSLAQAISSVSTVIGELAVQMKEFQASFTRFVDQGGQAMKPRVVVASAQGETIHIKCKQTGRVILKLKLRPDKHYRGDYELLLDMCDNHEKTGAVAYSFDYSARRELAEYEEVQP